MMLFHARLVIQIVFIVGLRWCRGTSPTAWTSSPYSSRGCIIVACAARRPPRAAEMSVDGINLALGTPAKHPKPDITIHK